MTNLKNSIIFFECIDEFNKDVKTLSKRYSSLKDDLEVVESVLRIRPDECPPMSFRINNLKVQTCVIKVKKIACKSLKGRGAMSGLRVVYAYFEQEGKIVYIELYHKSDKENEDRDRIYKYFK